MNEINKKNEKTDSTISNKHFEKLLKISLIIGIVIVSGFIIYYILTPEPGYVTFGILNEDQKAEGFTTEASINENITFYLSVGNYLDREFAFRFKILKGNNDTLVGSFPSNGSLFLKVGDFILEPNIERIFGVYNVSFSEVGADQRIIVELWEIKDESEVFYNNLYLWLNITN
ncbi:MAG: DUF1616 domain-containing protein [Candidatus Lokiarchaeota archaeon]|nr:DUF1616 domain-containing protein [Candidatus Lokiarchaeota archaeon]